MLEYGAPPIGPKEIDGLLVPPGKASSLLTDHLITGLSLPRKGGTCQIIHTYNPCWFSWVVKFEALFWMLGIHSNKKSKGTPSNAPIYSCHFEHYVLIL